jgi:hypothetical protein
MSLKHLSDTIYKAELPCTTKMVLLLLANYANEKSECYPSKAHLAKLGGMTERTVTNAVKRLIELGFVEIISQGGGIHSSGLDGKKYGKVNRYRVVEIVNPESSSLLENDMERDSKPIPNPESLSSNTETASINKESLSSNPERDSYNSLIDSSIDSSIDSKDLLSDSAESNVPAVVDDSVPFDAKAKRELLAEAFERVWVDYGRRGSKKPAEDKFLKLKLPDNRSEAIGLLQAIIDKAKQWGDLYAQYPSEVQFQPHAVRWVKEEKWNDEELPTIRKTNASTGDWASEMINEERF